MQNILVTGASGFIGRSLCRRLLESGCRVTAPKSRASSGSGLAPGLTSVAIDSIGPETRWEEALTGTDTVMHLAARVHVMKDKAADPLAEFRAVNTFGTENLARQAAAAGVWRFVFVRSIKVNGESTASDVGFTEADPHLPRDPYGVSKSEAELALYRIASKTGMEIVIIRPPLVYGPGVKGNFLAMLKALHRGIPLPLGAIVNRRSLVYRENLVDALMLCASHPAAAGQTYLVSDGEAMSTPDLLRKLGEALNVPARLLPVPVSVLRLGGKVLGKSGAMGRLLGSLVVNSGKIRRELGWAPPFSLAQGLQQTAEWFRSNQA